VQYVNYYNNGGNMKLSAIIIFLTFLFLSCKKEPVPERKKTETNREATVDMESVMKKLVEDIEKSAAPLEREGNEALWKAWLSGRDEDYAEYERLTVAYKKLFSDREKFRLIKEAKEKGNIRDPILKRQIDVYFNEFIENQIDEKLLEKIVAISTEVEKKFNVYRGKVDGKEVTMNDIKEILKNSGDRKQREKAWIAQKEVGRQIAAMITELIKLRNEAAKSVGFDNFYELHLSANELTKNEVKKIFDELTDATEKAFAEIKTGIDRAVMEKYRIKQEEIMPWDYEDPYFQEVPRTVTFDLDPYYSKLDIRDFGVKFFDEIGLDVHDIISRSSLYEQPGKNPHAFEICMDRKQDIRILCNLKNNEDWANTVLHELGHAVYDKNIDQSLPWILRTASNSFLTEGIAELFGRMSKKKEVLVKIAGAQEKDIEKITDDLKKSMKYSMLIFARFSAVMVNFEMEAYTDPSQDLNKLWWDLALKYQKMNKPVSRNEPDWATKIHIASAPVYYHNYIMGEIFASQFLNALARDILKATNAVSVDFTGNRELGKAVIDRVFQKGKTVDWRVLVKNATGEDLTSRYFAEEFVK
jgi:peptidyl-dipeptidase A